MSAQNSARRPSLQYSRVQSVANHVVVHEGWVLKKRRKKLQGFARRYFTLYQSGLLSYAFEPGQPVRDQMYLHQAVISTEPGRKDIHLDSNTATFHIKCLSTNDFDQWMTAFRRFIAIGAELRKSNSLRMAAHHQSTLKLARTGAATGAVLEDMGTTIHELEAALVQLKPEETPKRRQSSGRHKSDKEKHKDSSVFGLFKKVEKGIHHSSPHASEFGVESSHTEAGHYSDESYQRVWEVLHTLKSQHASLLKLQPSLALSEGSIASHGSPLLALPVTNEEEEEPSSDRFGNFTPSLKTQKRVSVITTGTDSLHEWFDASDGMDEGAQEFVLDAQTFDGSEQPNRLINNDSRSSFGDRAGGSSIDTDIADEEHPARRPSEDAQPDPTASALHVSRRAYLPAPVAGDEGSLFSMLKKNVGKDLSTIALPVSFNEPLTLLQRAAEELEYYDLLSQAASTTEPIDRMRYIAAFAVSSYAHTRHRTGRKGFNPMLAETYEDVRMKFIAEKVRHNPLEMAYHAEGKDWELYATSAGKTKFWGKSLEIIQLGTTHVKIGSDHFEWKKPSSFMRNLVVGTKYLEHCGQLIIENTYDGTRCVLDFKQNGYWGPSNAVSGMIYSESGKAVSHLEGKWDEQLSETVDASHLRILWRATPWPKDTQDYYGFTSFTMTLNEITDDIKNCLPPTDSRYRPDVRALEDGDITTADAEKLRVEEMQRERRRTQGEQQPRWFKQEGDEWVYAGGYWEARAKGWKDTKITPLW